MITDQRYKELSTKRNPTAREQSQMRVYEFVLAPPQRATVYLKRQILPGSIASRKVTVTTIDGLNLGWGWLKVPYKVSNHTRYTLEFTSIGGVKYRGTYYPSVSYADVRRVKT